MLDISLREPTLRPCIFVREDVQYRMPDKRTNLREKLLLSGDYSLNAGFDIPQDEIQRGEYRQDYQRG